MRQHLDMGPGADTYDEVKSQSAVKVAVVVRPLMQFEKDKGAKDIVEMLSNTKMKLPPKAVGGASQDGYPFDFDRVYRIQDASGNRQMFSEVVVPVVGRFCQGFNATVLAYGQTGSGKTYTMGTMATAAEITGKDPRAIIPRILNAAFTHMAGAGAKYDITLKAQYVEIYNEAINDLLGRAPRGATPGAAKLDIRETPGGDIFIDGATEVTITNLAMVAKILEEGNTQRATAAHKMNETSSRSHAILMLQLEQRAKPSAYKTVPQELRYLRSKFNLVDLAGSERQKDTGATGERFAEGVSINKGLLELGNCITALSSPCTRKHVPYRNSKLTRVLQDSLGGNSETLFIACVSPADTNHDTTLSTLRYASNARSIKNSLRLNNTLSLEEEVTYLREMVVKLQAENAELKAKL
ncbi:MAG: hypothetical protein WDW36_004996 [Sanguina aurantia]